MTNGAVRAQAASMLPLVLADLESVINSQGFIAFVGFLIIGIIAVHHSMQIGNRLRADAAKRESTSPMVATLERGVATADDLLDLFLQANKLDAKDLADPATRAAAEAHLKEAATKAIQAKLTADAPATDAAKAVAPVLLAALVFGLGLAPVACQHVEPMLLTRDTIVAADKTFLATQVIMNGLKPQLSPATWNSWLLFELRFSTSFHAARVLYDDAEKALEVAAQADGGVDSIAQADLKAAQQVVDSFVAQLDYWRGVVAQLSHPDGGVP